MRKPIRRSIPWTNSESCEKSKIVGSTRGCSHACLLTKCNKFVMFCRVKWEITYYNEKVQHNILRFSPVIQARYFNLTDRMQKFGPHLGMPHTRALGDGLFELRLKAKQGIGRVFFCTTTTRGKNSSIHRKIVMLHSFTKKARRTPKQERDTARKRLSELRDS